MTSKPAKLLILIGCLTLGACSASTSGPTLAAVVPPPSALVNVQPTAAPASATPEPSASPTASAGPSGSAEAELTPSPIDPCTLMTSDEASTAIGIQLGQGKSQIVGPEKVCTWAKGAAEVKLFLAPPTDPTQAKAYYEANKGEIPEGATITELPSLFDGSLIAKGPGLSGIFVLDANEFFELYCARPGCSDDAATAGATLIAGRLP